MNIHKSQSELLSYFDDSGPPPWRPPKPGARHAARSSDWLGPLKGAKEGDRGENSFTVRGALVRPPQNWGVQGNTHVTGHWGCQWGFPKNREMTPNPMFIIIFPIKHILFLFFTVTPK